MEPQIQYARTDDGVNIAFWSIGEGPGFVYMPNLPYSHCQVEWQFEPTRRLYEQLARGRRLIRYDGRGTGLSDRTSLDYSIEAQLRDLQAVVDRAGVERFALLGSYHTGPVAISYAAQEPQRVSHLLLWCGYERGSQYVESPQVLATRELIDKDWTLYTETNAHLVIGWTEGRRARLFAAFMRESVKPDAVKAAYAAFSEYDVSKCLPRVAAPTLVLHRRELPWLDASVARGLAAGIPDARLVLLEGDSGVLVTDYESTGAVIADFLGDRQSHAHVPYVAAGSGLRTIVFTDIERNTAMLQKLGDDAWRALVRELEQVTRAELARHGGIEIKTMGDGFLASFGSAVSALRCAIAIQRAIARANAAGHDELLVRIAINAGEPIDEGDDLFGTAVTAAARLLDHTRGGEVVVSDVVRQLVAGKGFLFADRGDAPLRGFDDPVRLYQLRLPDDSDAG